MSTPVNISTFAKADKLKSKLLNARANGLQVYVCSKTPKNVGKKPYRVIGVGVNKITVIDTTDPLKPDMLNLSMNDYDLFMG
jgi:hypothetical protein